MFLRQLGAVKQKPRFLVRFRPNMQFQVFLACSSLKDPSMVICSCEGKLNLSRTIELKSAVSSLYSKNDVSELKSTFLVPSNFAQICSLKCAVSSLPSLYYIKSCFWGNFKGRSENEQFCCDLANLWRFRSLLLEVTQTVLSALKSSQFAIPETMFLRLFPGKK